MTPLVLAAPLPMALWAVWRTAEGGWRWEYVLFLVVAPGLAWTSERTRRLFWGLYPFALLALAYDSMRLWIHAGLTPEAVHVCDLRALDARWFGAGGQTVHEWLQAHASLALDLLCAVPYGTFIEVAFLFAVYLFVTDRRAMQRFGWTFLAVNLCAFVGYRFYPAAPPWYVHAHGCVADLATRASEGPNLARVDAWTGLGYFRAFYGRSTNVFGAVPSLHVVYPLLVVLFGWARFGPLGKALSAGFFALMCFAAVYLDHHWVLDVVLGVGLTLVVHRAVARVAALRADNPSPGPFPASREGVSGSPSRPAGRGLGGGLPGEGAAIRLATWFGSGRSPIAPGTVGTLAALPVYFAVRPFGGAAVLASAVVVTVAGLWSSGVVVASTGAKDPQYVVIDEVAGVLFALAASSATLGSVAAAVLAFRTFDVLKPWPAHLAERALPGGWGVMLDDVVAGAWAAGTVALLTAFGAL